MSNGTIPLLEPGVLVTIISFNRIANYTAGIPGFKEAQHITYYSSSDGYNLDFLRLDYNIRSGVLGHLHIFAASKKWSLPNCLCVVTRYFGITFILFLTTLVRMFSVAEVNLDFFASVATQGYYFIRLLAFLLFTLTFTIVVPFVMNSKSLSKLRFLEIPTSWPITGCIPLNAPRGVFINFIQFLSPGIYLILTFFAIFNNWRLLGRVPPLMYTFIRDGLAFLVILEHCQPKHNGCCGYIPSYVPLLYQIALRRASLGIKALPQCQG
ncbi:hypothetical protein BU17DRAFT_63339 [Hysterangium stoloniferum]|nr:hypothetical protein BU17DRAFT_63339 [Hysterangium stoloniferum]